MNVIKNSFFTLIVWINFGHIFSGNASVAVVNGLTHEYVTSQGKIIKGSISIQNNTDLTANVKIYQSDYRFSFTGESWYEKPGTNARSNANWLNLSSLYLTLQPRELHVFEFEIKIPQIDTLKGSYWSVIMVEEVAPESSLASKGIQINTVMRYAVQIVTHIGDTGSQKLEFLQAGLSIENENLFLTVDLQNGGERSLSPKLTLELFNQQGISSGVFTVDPKRIYPGCSVKIRIPVTNVAGGNYTGVLVADCENDLVFGTNLTLEI